MKCGRIANPDDFPTIVLGKHAPDVTGVRSGRLVALRPVGQNFTSTVWLCLCSCGNYTITRGASLTNGETTSCGCIAVEKAKERKRGRNPAEANNDGSVTVLLEISTGSCATV